MILRSNRLSLLLAPVLLWPAAATAAGSTPCPADQRIEIDLGAWRGAMAAAAADRQGSHAAIDELLADLQLRPLPDPDEMVLGSGDMERALPAVVRHIEEPRVGQSYPNYYAAKLASKSVKVVLGGTGGDELFAGYPWRYYRAVVNDDFKHYIDKYYLYWQRLIDNKDIHRVFAPIADQTRDVWTRDIFRDVFSKHADQLTRPEDYINHSLYFEAKTFLHGLLVVEDKLSSNIDLCMNVDVQGASSFRRAAETNPLLNQRLVTVFLMPPDLEELRHRLRGRATDAEDEIERRLQTAISELGEWRHYDYCVHSRSKEEDYEIVRAIWEAEKRRVWRMTGPEGESGQV